MIASADISMASPTVVKSKQLDTLNNISTPFSTTIKDPDIDFPFDPGNKKQKADHSPCNKSFNSPSEILIYLLASENDLLVLTQMYLPQPRFSFTDLWTSLNEGGFRR